MKRFGVLFAARSMDAVPDQVRDDLPLGGFSMTLSRWKRKIYPAD
jgi:hypothetical protein